jgi:hypothetical protein
MGLEELRARLDRMLSGSGDRRGRAGMLRDALLELKVAAGENRDALAKAERELAAERQRLADAERRGRLAAEIGDAETTRIAGEFSTRHAERVALLERKTAVIRDELAYVDREYQALAAEFQSVRRGVDPIPGPDPLEATERELDSLRMKAEREAREEAVRRQLEHLKKKMRDER